MHNYYSHKFEEKIIFDSVNFLMTSSEFLPSLSKLMITCKESKTKLSGIPNVTQAYREACNAKNNFEKLTWSHPIVFYIGSETGWDFLWTQPEKESYKEFVSNYNVFVEDFINGKVFNNPNFPELPKDIKIKPNKTAQLTQIQKLKNKLIN